MSDTNKNPTVVPDGEDWDVICTYTRAQAIEDGVLVDMTQGDLGETLREAGFRLHTAMTTTAFGQVIGVGDLPAGQDVRGRWWDVLMVLRYTIDGNRDADRVHFRVSVWNGRKNEDVNLWALIGPGDAGRPVLTIMLEGED